MSICKVHNSQFSFCAQAHSGVKMNSNQPGLQFHDTVVLSQPHRYERSYLNCLMIRVLLSLPFEKPPCTYVPLPNTCEHVRTHPNTSDHVRTRLTTSDNVRKHQKTYNNVQTPTNTYKHVQAHTTTLNLCYTLASRHSPADNIVNPVRNLPAATAATAAAATSA